MSPTAAGIPGHNGTLIAAAGQRWDAVRVPRFIGLQALNHLVGQEGAIVMDPGNRRVYFLVPPGTTRSWNLPQTTALGETSHVVLPADDKEIPPGPYWLVSPRRGRLCTSTEALHNALRTVLGPRPTTNDQDRVRPDLGKQNIDQVKGLACALCGARLYATRSLGVFCTGDLLLQDPTELWACNPVCRRIDNPTP
ncbi:MULTISPECIES: hypothetical protein [unclassified Streptomyces]|uniref:hypothetical protein n=1 Tax=unclassified Streptomyces TaxID=2593676 RepID=UPI002E204620|nr:MULTISPECIES: hypothetical protein [unclassified Streptomyces]WSX47470.1 hypothetical protein OG760_37865 [Streptomyces sp. NBC_00963]